jgi:hypothetical protein
MREGDSMKFFTAMLFVVMAVAQTTTVTVTFKHPVTKGVQVDRFLNESAARTPDMRIDGCTAISVPSGIVDGGVVIADCTPKDKKWESGKVNPHLIFNGRLVKTGDNEFTIRWGKPTEKWQWDK